MKYISNSRFIGICKGYVTYSTSTDGITWDEDNEFDSPRKYIDIYDNNNYVIITSENDRSILISEDGGISWDIHTIPIANSKWKMFFASNKYFLLGENTNIALISLNGQEFHQVNLSQISGNWTNLWSIDVEDSPTVFYVPIPERNQLAYSYDGIFWYRASHIDRLEYGNGFFVAIDLATQTEEETLIHYSRGGYTWEKIKVPFGGSVKDITFGDGRFIIITNESCDYVYQTLNMTKWEKLYLNLVTDKKFIAYSELGDGFSILTNTEDIHLIHDNVKVQESQLFESMNQIVGACGTTIVVLDYSGLNIWICKDTNYIWKNTGLVVNPNNTWNIKSLSTSIIVYCNEVFYCYNIFTEQWTEIEYIFEEIIAVEEVTVLLDHKTVRKIAIIADNRLFFMDGAYSTDKANQFVVDFDNGYDLSLVPLTIDTVIFDMCPNSYDKSIHLITSDSIYSIHDFKSDYTYSVETLTMPNIRGAMIQGVKLANNRYMMITNSHYFYISTDSINWKEYEFVDGMIPTKILSTNTCFTGYIHDGVNQYIFYTENGKDIRYQNFSLLYGAGSDITTTRDDIYITKYSDILTKLKFGESSMKLSHDGIKDNIDYHIHPKKPSFDSGSFIKTENMHIHQIL